jgi:hypothetical protein
MTTKQRMSILLDRWPRACRAQGWDHKRRDLRLQVISDAVGREITSMNDLDNSADIDKVYAHLGHLADQVTGTIETLPADTIEVSAGRDAKVEQQDSPGYRRRITWLIKKHGQPLGGIPYILTVARHKFHLTAGLSTIDDLTTAQLHQLMITLAARKSKLTRAAAAPEPAPELANQPF